MKHAGVICREFLLVAFAGPVQMATAQGMAVNPGQYEGPRNAAGEPEGQGTFRANDGGTIYEGQYLNGKAEGRGTYCTEQGDIYEGEYKAGKEEGRGVFRFGHGGTYDGEWEAGKPHGRGTFVYPDGATYEGEYVKGQMQGPGTFYYPSGEVDVGLFKDSVAWGEVARWTADRGDAFKLFMGKARRPGQLANRGPALHTAP